MPDLSCGCLRTGLIFWCPRCGQDRCTRHRDRDGCYFGLSRVVIENLGVLHCGQSFVIGDRMIDSLPARGWWLCPNDPPCPHSGAVHDVYDYDDPSPQCCMEGCRCGHPDKSISVVVPKGAEK